MRALPLLGKEVSNYCGLHRKRWAARVGEAASAHVTHGADQEAGTLVRPHNHGIPTRSRGAKHPPEVGAQQAQHDDGAQDGGRGGARARGRSLQPRAGESRGEVGRPAAALGICARPLSTHACTPSLLLATPHPHDEEARCGGCGGRVGLDARAGRAASPRAAR
jgi:hypothetical protein